MCRDSQGGHHPSPSATRRSPELLRAGRLTGLWPSSHLRLVSVSFRHPEPLDRVTLEIKLDDHHGFLANDPTIVARLDGHNLRPFVFDPAAVWVLEWDFT